jgi:uncharacterized protein YbjT (DUF2867 family)
MKLLILGATGATGRLLVDRALAAGHAVTALVRDPDKAGLPSDKIVLVKGRATEADDVAGAAAGCDAVLSALGPRTAKDPVCAEAARAVVDAMKRQGLKRVVWLSAGGVGDSAPQIRRASFVFGRIIMPLFLRRPYANHARAEETLRASDLDWTVLRPVQLVDVSTGAQPAALPIGEVVPARLKIARTDVAAFMLDELVARAHVGAMPILY